MRWKGFIVLAVLVGTFAALSIFLMDRWIESGLEKAGSAITGAKVEIDGLHFSVFTLTLKWDRIQVTDPNNTMTNLVETGRVAFRMHMPALLRRRTVIREMTLADVRSGTPRKYDGAIPRKPKPPKPDEPGALDKAREKLMREVRNLPVMHFDARALKEKLNLDTLIVMAELSMPRKLDSAQTDILATSGDWENFFQAFRPDDDLKEIRDTFTQIDPAAIGSVPELLDVLDRAQSARKKLGEIQDTIRTRQKAIRSDFVRVHGYARSVDDWFRDDYHAVLAKARLPDLGIRQIGLLVFGRPVAARVDQILGYVQTVRRHMPRKSDKPKKEKKPRLKGQTIHFTDRHGWPAFLIEQIHLSGQSGPTAGDRGLMLSGEAGGITSQPWVYGRPTLIALKGEKADGRSMRFDASLDHVKETAVDRFDFQMNAISLNNVHIGESDYLPARIGRGKADLSLSGLFEGDRIDIRLAVKAHGLDFDFRELESSNQFIGILRDVIRKIDVLTLDARISGEGDGLVFRLDSNIDNRVSRELRSMATRALEDAQNQVRARLESIRDEKLAGVNRIYASKRAEIEGRIDAYAKQADEYRMMAEAKIDAVRKEIDDRKKAEEDRLKKRARDAIDGVIGR